MIGTINIQRTSGTVNVQRTAGVIPVYTDSGVPSNFYLFYRLLENGDNYLLENGDYKILG